MLRNNALILLLVFGIAVMASGKMEKVGTTGKNYKVKKSSGIVFCEYNGDFEIRTKSVSQWCGDTPTFWSFGNNGCTKYPGSVGLTDWKSKSQFKVKPVYKRGDPKPWYQVVAKNNCASKYVTVKPGVGDLPLAFDRDDLFRIDAVDKTNNAADCQKHVYIVSRNLASHLNSDCDAFDVSDSFDDTSSWMMIGV